MDSSRQNVVSWEEAYTLAGQIYRQLPNKPITIVSIGSGGMWLGQYLQYRYYKERAVILKHEIVWAKKYNGIKNGVFRIVSEDSSIYDTEGPVVICDDIEETGETMLEVRKRFLKSEDVKGAVLIQRENSRVSNYVGYKTNGKEWIVFPWERFTD